MFQIITTPSMPELTNIRSGESFDASEYLSSIRTSLTPSVWPNSPVRRAPFSISYTRIDLSVPEAPISNLGFCPGTAEVTVNEPIITVSFDSESAARKELI
jgi:hypothetical protein